MKKQIITENAPKAIGPYSQGICIGNTVYVSGQIPVDPKTGIMADTIEEQAHQVFKNLAGILSEEGLTFQNVVKTAVFLDDLSNFAAVNAIYESYFSTPYPARSCVQVAAIPKGAKVEIECIAVKD